MLNVSHTSVHVETADGTELSGNDPTATLTNDSLEPEHAVRISATRNSSHNDALS